MRLAIAMTAVVLMTGVRAHADILVSPETQETAAPAAAPNSLGALEMAPVRLAVNPIGTLDVPAPQLTGQSTAVTPEPSTMVLMSTGMVGLFALAWRRRAEASRAVAASIA